MGAVRAMTPRSFSSFPGRPRGYATLWASLWLGAMLHGDPVELAVDSIGGVLAVAVRGALIGASTEPLRTCLDQAIRGARPVVLDLTETTGIDRGAIETLLQANRRLGTRLRLVIERGGELRQAFRREGVAHVLSLHGSRAEALAAAAPR